mgnify:FL=1
MSGLDGRIKKLENQAPTSKASDDLQALRRRCEMLLGLPVIDSDDPERRDQLLRTVWEIEHGHWARWLEQDDAARGKRFRDLTMDERAWETTQRMLRGVDFLHIELERPTIPEADMAELERRHPLVIESEA